MKQDTIFILFEKSENQNLSLILRKTEIVDFLYIFREGVRDDLLFGYQKYESFDNPNKKSNLDVKILKKRFLKKDKDKIIDISFMYKYGFRETFFLIYNNKKTIYIIDKNEIKRNKILAREVNMYPSYIEE